VDVCTISRSCMYILAIWRIGRTCVSRAWKRAGLDAAASSVAHPHRAQAATVGAPGLPERALEELEDPPVLVGPRARLDEALALHRVDGQLLAWTSHRGSTTGAGRRAFTALRSVGRLDVLHEYACAALGRAPCIHAPSHLLVTNPDEKSRLVLGPGETTLFRNADRRGPVGVFCVQEGRLVPLVDGSIRRADRSFHMWTGRPG